MCGIVGLLVKTPTLREKLGELINWCSVNCCGKWYVQTNLDTKGRPESFTFLFKKHEDSIRFGLICK